MLFMIFSLNNYMNSKVHMLVSIFIDAYKYRYFWFPFSWQLEIRIYSGWQKGKTINIRTGIPEYVIWKYESKTFVRRSVLQLFVLFTIGWCDSDLQLAVSLINMIQASFSCCILMDCEPCTVNPALWTLHCELGTVNSALWTLHCAL